MTFIKKIMQGVDACIKLPWRWQIRKVGTSAPVRDTERHIYLTGKTGSGKSSVLEQWVYYHRYTSRKKENLCIIVIDPHGDTVEKIKKTDLAKRYFKRLVYIDPFLKSGYTPCINPLSLDDRSPASVELYTQQLVRVFEDVIPDAKLSNYMRAILTPCLATLLAFGSADLTHLQQFMSKTKSEQWVQLGKYSSIPAHKQFFQQEFTNRMYDATKGSIYTKIQSLLNSSTFYNMTTGVNTIDLERCIRQGKIILFNLSKGKMGEEVSETLGRLFIAQIKRIALSRANLPPHLRNQIYLIIDEADTFVKGNSFNVILKEARKYGLSLFLCTQNIIAGKAQSELKRNVLSNTAVKYIGSNSIGNLKPLGQETNIEVKELLRLRQFEFYLKSGDQMPRKMKLKNVFGPRSPLLLSRGQMRSLNHRIVIATSMYKPIVKAHAQVEERIEDLPGDLQQQARDKASPTPKFIY